MGARDENAHATHVRRRKGRWVATCSCGWSEEAMSGFGGWAAARRHVDATDATARRPPPTRRVPDVRLLDRAPGRGDDRPRH